jgi:hypothetical protein
VPLFSLRWGIKTEWRKRLAIVLWAIPSLAMAFVVVPGNDAPATAATTTGILVARPAEIDFHAKRVGTDNYKRTKITNTGQSDVRLLVTAGLPDDFHYGLLPGQACPALTPGDLLRAGDSCYAVVEFTPSEFFVGWQAAGQVIATAYDPTTDPTADPTTWVVIDELTIPVFGEAVR